MLAQLRQLAREMMAVMYEDDGVGLAAPQVGLNVRLMVFNPEGDPDQADKEVVLVNPRIVSQSKRKQRGEEGCLSFRDKQVRRVPSIRQRSSVAPGAGCAGVPVCRCAGVQVRLPASARRRASFSATSTGPRPSRSRRRTWRGSHLCSTSRAGRLASSSTSSTISRACCWQTASCR